MPTKKKPDITFCRLRAVFNEADNTITIRVEGRKNPTETFSLTQHLSALSRVEKQRLAEIYKRIFLNSFYAVSPEEFHRHFCIMSNKLAEHVTITLKNKVKQTYEEQTIWEIGKHHLRFLQELRSGHTAPLERTAWFSRNVFELFLWLSFITMSAANSRDFIGYVVLDTQEILEGSSNYFPDMDAPEYKKQFESQRVRYRKFAHEKQTQIPLGQLKIRELANLAHTRFKDRIKGLNILADLDGFYRLFSKFVHPSPYFISGAITDATAANNRYVMLYKVLEYSEVMLALYREGTSELEPQGSKSTLLPNVLIDLEKKAWMELSKGKFGEFSKYAHKWHKESNMSTTSPDGPFFPLLERAADKTKL